MNEEEFRKSFRQAQQNQRFDWREALRMAWAEAKKAIYNYFHPWNRR